MTPSLCNKGKMCSLSSMASTRPVRSANRRINPMPPKTSPRVLSLTSYLMPRALITVWFFLFRFACFVSPAVFLAVPTAVRFSACVFAAVFVSCLSLEIPFCD